MKNSSPLFGAFVLALASLPLAAAAQNSTLPEEAERLMDEGMSGLIRALDLLLKTVPQYAAPEVQPNGDIIIRRLHPEDEAPEKETPPTTDEDAGNSTET